MVVRVCNGGVGDAASVLDLLFKNDLVYVGIFPLRAPRPVHYCGTKRHLEYPREHIAQFK